jgi:hypothetical protein
MVNPVVSALGIRWGDFSDRAFGLTAIPLTAIAGYLAIHFAPSLSGDALIHLSIMERSAAGDWFAFNPGHADGSSSSPLWTLLGAILWRVGGPSFAIFGMKAVCYASWVALGGLIFTCGQLFGSPVLTAALAGLTAIALPGTAMNSLQGMENGSFAVIVLTAFVLLGRQFAAPQVGAGSTGTIFLLLGVAIAMRPEGAAVAVVASAFWVIDLRRKHWRGALRLLPLAFVSCAIAFGPLLWWHGISTDHIVAPSSVSRMMAARRQMTSLHWGPLWLHLAAPVRLAAYSPLAIIAVIGVHRASSRSSEAGHLTRSCAVTALAGLVFYSFGTGAFHTSRYLIWVFALLAVPGSVGLDWMARAQSRRGRVLLALVLLWLVGATAIETYARITKLGSGYRIADVLSSIGRRTSRTNALLAEICRPGCCDRVDKPAIAAFEVQIRWFLDERITVRSMDGVTSGPFGRPVRFAANGCPDLDAIMDDTGIVALTDNPRSRFASCSLSPRLERISDGWNRVGWTGDGWEWNVAERMMVRSCRFVPPASSPAQ